MRVDVRIREGSGQGQGYGGEVVSLRFSPFFMPAMPWSQPLITSCRGPGEGPHGEHGQPVSTASTAGAAGAAGACCAVSGGGSAVADAQGGMQAGAPLRPAGMRMSLPGRRRSRPPVTQGKRLTCKRRVCVVWRSSVSGLQRSDVSHADGVANAARLTRARF